MSHQPLVARSWAASWSVQLLIVVLFALCSGSAAEASQKHLQRGSPTHHARDHAMALRMLRRRIQAFLEEQHHGHRHHHHKHHRHHHHEQDEEAAVTTTAQPADAVSEQEQQQATEEDHAKDSDAPVREAEVSDEDPAKGAQQATQQSGEASAPQPQQEQQQQPAEEEEHEEDDFSKDASNEASAAGAVVPTKVEPAAAVQAAAAVVSSAQVDRTKKMKLEKRMRKLQQELVAKERAARSLMKRGSLDVNGPLPDDFAERFVRAAAKATGSAPDEVKLIDSHAVKGEDGIVELDFSAPSDVLDSLEDQAGDPDSKFARGELHDFLVERRVDQGGNVGYAPAPAAKGASAPCPPDEMPETPVTERGIDIDTAMPYGDLEPFGREDTAQELTEKSIQESDEMVDQLERAEVAEEKRAVFRALTRLRGAAITSFDGVARAQSGNIDEYNKVHKWRNTHPLHHLADEEADVTKWAFPDNADF